MAALVRERSRSGSGVPRGLVAVCAVVLASLVTFILLPGDVARKTHLALHGLCAQRPSHSLLLGGMALPMDARMTGIYLGAATTLIWLVVAGRARAAGNLSRPVVAVLALFVAAMALDGFNALLVDLRLPHPYAPSNLLRLITGILSGTSLGSGLGYLFAVSMWNRADHGRAIVGRPVELAIPILAAAAVGALAVSGLGILYAPFAIGSLAAAIAVFWVLCLVLLALVMNRAWTFRSYAQMSGLAVAAWGVAVVTIGILAVARLGAEQVLGLPRLT